MIDNTEILNKAYLLRKSFISKIEKYIFLKQVDTLAIYNEYVNYINILIDKDHNYLECVGPKPFNLKRASSKKKNEFFSWIYNMTSNINNAFILSYEAEIDSSLYFSGFSTNDSDIDLDEALDRFKNEAPYDIEYVELLHIFNDEDLEIILNNQMLDIFFLFQFALYQKRNNLVIYARYLDYCLNKGMKSYILKYCLDLLNWIK